MPVKPSSVLLVTPRWTRDGGVAAHVKASAAALIASGVRVSVLAARVDAEEPVSGAELHEVASLMNDGLPALERLGAALDGAPDVIHLHQVEDPALTGALRASAPVLTSAHDYVACTSGVHYFAAGHVCSRAHGPGCVPNLVRCAHTRYPQTLPSKYLHASRRLASLHGSDMAISYSTAVDRHLAQNGLSARAIIPYFPTMPARQGGGHADRRRVVFSGRLVRPKGVGVLIRAAREVDGEFVICGDGRELAAMRALASRLGVQDRVVFRGWLGGGDLAQELADASITVLPSLWPEPFGLVGIEGFAAARPAVATRGGGVGDWLKDGEGGLLVPAGDHRLLARALSELLADPERQRQMGLAGQRLVAERFSPEQHVAKLLDAYSAARSRWSASR